MGYRDRLIVPKCASRYDHWGKHHPGSNPGIFTKSLKFKIINMGRYYTIDAEIDLADIDTSDLIEELKRRKKFGKNFIRELTENMDEEIELCFDSPKGVLDHLRSIFHLRPFHGKERIIQEINEL